MLLATRTLTVAAKPGSLGAVTEFVRRGAQEAGLPESRIAELDLLMEEVAMNVCSYAYPSDTLGEMTVAWSVPAMGELRVEVADRGVEFDPLRTVPPDLTASLDGRPIGGLGIHLVKTLAASLTYRREQGWNRLTFGISAGS